MPVKECLRHHRPERVDEKVESFDTLLLEVGAVRGDMNQLS
jgi:hypothetical protein